MEIVTKFHGDRDILGRPGKTQLAIEYAHRFAADYQLIWWLTAEKPSLIADQPATLAGQLDPPTAASVPTPRRRRWPSLAASAAGC